MMQDETTEKPMRARIGAAAAAVVLGIAGLGAAGCGDDDNEGPLEEAGQTLDEGASEAGDTIEEGVDDVQGSEAADDVEEAADDAGSEIDEAADDAGEAAEQGAEEATTDDDK